MLRWLVRLLVAVSVWSTSAVGLSATKPDCSNPRRAADSVFLWQQKQRRNLDFAAACLDPTGRSPEELRDLAGKIRVVYDAHGAWIAMDKIADAPDYEDEEGASRVVPHALLPDIVIEKQGERWLWTEASLHRVDALYADVGTLIRLVERLPPAFRDVTFFGVALWQYLCLLILVALGLLARMILAAVVARRIQRVARGMGQTWPSKLVEVIASPGALLVTAVILRIGYPQLILPVAWAKALASTVQLLVTISVVWAIYRSVDVLAAKLTDRAAETNSKLDDQMVPLLRKTLKVVVCIVGALVALQNLDFDVTTLFASVSIGGLALGLAARDTLANLFGSVSIFVDQPFQIGDWIEVDGTTGSVEEVGFRSTRIRTGYDSVVVMPNAKIADAKVDNYGRRRMRRCSVTLGLTYDATPEQLQAFCDGCRAIILAHPLTNKTKLEVHMSGFGDSALEVMLYFFFECDSWTQELTGRHEIFLSLIRLARDVGVSFAFPTRSIHIETHAEPTDKRLPPPPSAAALAEALARLGPAKSADGA